MKIKKILIIGEVYSQNLGDGVLCECLKYILNENISNVELEFKDISGKEDYTKNKENKVVMSINLDIKIEIKAYTDLSQLEKRLVI